MTIQYRVHLESGGPECMSGASLPINLYDGVPFLETNLDPKITYIEVYVSGSTGAQEFAIVGTELNFPSYVNEGRIVEVSTVANDPGRFLGWERSPTAPTLTLSFRSPGRNDSIYGWTLTQTFGPPPVIKVKVKRQEVANSGACSTWPDIE